MTEESPDIVVLRKGEEGLSMADYVEQIRLRLPDHDVRLAATPTQEHELSRRATVITGGELPENVLDTTVNLQLFAGTTSGYGHLPMEQLREQGVAVTNAAGIHAPGIAEQTIGNILIFARNIHKGWQRKQSHQWRHYQATELQNSTVTIVGLGAIGTAVASRLDGFGVETIGIRYTPKKGGPTDEVHGFKHEKFHAALARTDYLVIACPLTDTTEDLVDSEALGTLPPDAVVVNAARGGVVDTRALVTGLQKGSIRGAALDVTDPEPLPPEHPLWSLDNVLITPHMGGHTPQHWRRLASILSENVERIETNGQDTELKNQILQP